MKNGREVGSNIGSCLSFNIACGFSAGFFYFGSKQIKKGHLYFIIPKPVSEKNSRRHEFEGFFIDVVNESNRYFYFKKNHFSAEPMALSLSHSIPQKNNFRPLCFPKAA